MAEIPTLKSALARQFTGRAEGTAARLRELATRIEHIAADIDRVPPIGSTSAGDLAHRIVHELMWGLANAHVDGIVSAAADYDRQIVHVNQSEVTDQAGEAR